MSFNQASGKFRFSRDTDGTFSVQCPDCGDILEKDLPTFQAVVYKSLLHKCNADKDVEANAVRTPSTAEYPQQKLQAKAQGQG